MKDYCPNKSNKYIKAEFDELVKAVEAAGYDDSVAYLIWHKTEGEGLGNHPGLADSDSFAEILETVGGNRQDAIISLANDLLSDKQINSIPSKSYTVYQGYLEEDDRHYNYWTTDEKEASNYGPNIRKATISTKGFLNYYTDEKAGEIRREFQLLTGKRFDILDNSEEGLKTQQEFFEFVENKGYKGISFIATDDQEDNRYLVSFGSFIDPIPDAISEFAKRLGFDIKKDESLDTFVDFASKIITMSDFSDSSFNRVLAQIAIQLMPNNDRDELLFVGKRYGRNDISDIYVDIYDALNNKKNWILENKTLFDKILTFISNLINMFIDQQKYYEHLVDKAAKKILDKNSKWYTTVINKGFEQKLLNIESLKQSSLYNIYKVLTDLGASLDGSAAVRMLGTLYRKGEEDFHDIDFSKPYDDFSWEIKLLLDTFFESYKDETNSFMFKDSYTYRKLREIMLEKATELLKKSDIYKELSKHYSDIYVKHACKTKELGLFVTLSVDGNPVDIFYAKDVKQHEINGIKVTDFSVAFAAKLIMHRDKDIRDIINFHKFANKSISKNDIKSKLIDENGNINWDYFEQLLNKYHNNQPDSMFSKGRYTLSTRPEKHFSEEKNTLNHIKFVTQSMLDLFEGKYDIDLPFVSEARASLKNQKDLMILAAMFHDSAKPYMHGDIHGWESADILRDVIGANYDNRLAEWAVRHHMPMPFSHKAEFSLSNPEALEVAKNIARDARRIGIDANTAINAFVLINAADVINGRELDVDDNWAKKAGEEGLEKYNGDISVKNVLSIELKEKVALLKKAFDEIKNEDFGDTTYNYSYQERFDYQAFPEGGREDKKLPYLNNKLIAGKKQYTSPKMTTRSFTTNTDLLSSEENVLTVYNDSISSKLEFLRKNVKSALKGKDFKVKKTKDTPYIVISPKNVVKDYYPYNDVRDFVRSIIEEAGGNPDDFYLRPSLYSGQDVVVSIRRKSYIAPEMKEESIKPKGDTLASPTNALIQQQYDKISDKIKNLFSELYKKFDRMTDKSTTRRKAQTKIFLTIAELKKNQSDMAIKIALQTAAELLGVINQQTGAPLSGDNLYAWFMNLENKTIPYENVTPQQLLDIYKYQIGFYRSVLAIIPDSASVLLNQTTRASRQSVLDLLDIIENFWKHAVEMVGEREIDNMIDSFTGLAIPQDLKDNMKIVYRDWLHKNWFHGDINAFTRLFTSYGQSGNPIVKIAFHLTQYAETKTQEELLATSTPLLKKFLAVNTAASWTKPGWLRIFQEVNNEGIPTGKWVRDINYGQYEQDLNMFVQGLNDSFDNMYGYHYVYDDLGMPKNSVTGLYAEDEEWINGVLPTYIQYLLAIYDWKCEHANLRYTFDYYRERLSRPYDEHDYPEGHGLSLKTLQQYQNIQDTINYYLGLCTGEDGVPHPELPKADGGLTDAERMELDKAKDDLKRISSPFYDDGTPKVDEEYQMAMEIQTWEKYISNKRHGTIIDRFMFSADETIALKLAIQQNDPSILANFYKYNSEVRIKPEFLESIFGWSENTSSADIIIKQIYQKCLESLFKIKDNVYSRDIEPFKNNTDFWVGYQQLVQDVMDNRKSVTIKNPTEDVESVADYCAIRYTDPHGNYLDIFGNIATPATPDSEIMTWFGYMINYYKNIAIANNGVIQGVNDSYGNPVIFYGSDMLIAEQVKNTLFTYERTWFDKSGNMHTKREPLPLFTVLLPKNKNFIEHVPIGRYSRPAKDLFTNPNFDKNSGISEQPKKVYYDNSAAFRKVTKDKKVKELYDACIQCMLEMLKIMGFNNKTFNYKLPMLNADTSALLSRGNLSAILKSAYTVQNDDSDMRNIDDAIKKADGTIDFDIPLRLLQDLKDMRTLSSDVVQSVILYAQMAYNYRNKKAILDTMLTIHDNLTPEVRNRTATDYDRFNNTNMDPAINDEDSLKQYEAMMDSTMYGIDTGKQSKVHKEASPKEILARKTGTAVVRFEAVATLGLNLLSMFAGGFDSMSKMLRESIMNRYMSFADLIKSFGYVMMQLPKVIANWGNPLANCKIVAMMQLNSVSKDYTNIFDKLNHNRFFRTANRLLMGGFSMFDYFSNMIMLRAHYRNVRFYDGNVIPKGFYTAYEMRQAFKLAGKSWKEGSLAHSLCKTSLWNAYQFVDGKAVVRPQFEQYVTDKVKTDIRSKSLQRSALYNGMAPDNDRAAYLKTVWGKAIFAMRNWYQMVLQRNLVGTDDTSVRNVTDTKNERIKYGKSFFKPGKKVESITEEQSANRMGWNFETNTPQEEIWKAFFRSAFKILRIGWAVLHVKFGQAKDIKLSNVEKYAIRGILTQIAIIQLLYHAFIPIMNSAQKVPMPVNKKQSELTYNINNNLGDLPILWLSNATIRSYESNVAELNIVEPKNFIKTPSALFGALDKQMALYDMAQEGLGLSTHTLDETITSGSKYKYFTRGERYAWQSFGPANSLMTSLTVQGVKYNTQWYMNMYGDKFRRDGYDFTVGNSAKRTNSFGPKVPKMPKMPKMPKAPKTPKFPKF